MVQSDLSRVDICSTESTKGECTETIPSVPRREHGESETVHVCANVCVCWEGRRDLYFGDKKMRNQRKNILEFNKAEVVLIQSFCRSKFPHPAEIP